jgi:hypothetical protein
MLFKPETQMLTKMHQLPKAMVKAAQAEASIETL